MNKWDIILLKSPEIASTVMQVMHESAAKNGETESSINSNRKASEKFFEKYTAKKCVPPPKA